MRFRGTFRRGMDEHQVSGSARILKDNEERLINILGRVSHLRLFFSPFPRLFLLFLLSRSYSACSPVFPATRRSFCLAAARAPDCNRNGFVNYRILRPRATSAAPSTEPPRRAARKICTRTYPRDGRDDRPPVLPTHARTISGPRCRAGLIP